jgi:hypothetical protein
MKKIAATILVTIALSSCGNNKLDHTKTRAMLASGGLTGLNMVADGTMESFGEPVLSERIKGCFKIRDGGMTIAVASIGTISTKELTAKSIEMYKSCMMEDDLLLKIQANEFVVLAEKFLEAGKS